MEGEGSADRRCNLLYYCASIEDDFTALFHQHNPPDQPSGSTQNDLTGLDLVYHNARILLDEDRGGFQEVYISSRESQISDRLETSASSLPTVVLIDLPCSLPKDAPSDSEGEKKLGSAVAFMRALAADVQGAHYLKHVIIFALTPGQDSQDAETTTTTGHLAAGAVDTVRSPLSVTDISRLVGQVQERTRPPAHLIGSTMAQNLVNSILSTNDPGQPYHRPDESVSAERAQFVYDSIAEWAFPAHDLDMDELTCAAAFMLEHLLRAPDLQQFRIPRSDLMALLLATRRQYKHEREVYYHNWRHAVDVTQSLYQFLLSVGICPPADPDHVAKKQRTPVESLVSPLDGLMLLVSAIGHDVGHPGVNNAFLVACNHPLAQMYNDKSVLENYHCAAYFQLLRRHWPSLGKLQSFRVNLISNILSTDMQRHFDYMSQLSDLRQKVANPDDPVEGWSNKDKEHTRELIMALMMKAADISNIARPFQISSAWAKILMNEFARQGELESELEIPTCLFGGPPDRGDVLAAAQSQKGFMTLFGLPLFQGIAEVLPSVSCSLDTLVRNRAVWEEVIAAEKDKREALDDRGHATFASVGKEQVAAAAAARHHHSEPELVPLDGAQPPSTPVRRVAQTEDSPMQHPATEERQRLATGYSLKEDGKRASAPLLGSINAPPMTPLKGTSRRSSKDVALDHLHQLNNTFNQSSFNAGSRRGSADADFHLNQSFPNSRRGSKDESLTTILVTSQGSPGRGSPANGVRLGGSPSRNNAGNGRRSAAPLQKQSAARTSVPSARSHATSSATATTQRSPSSQSSSGPNDDDTVPSTRFSPPSSSAGDDPFTLPSALSSNNLDGTQKSSTTDSIPPTPTLLPESKGDVPKAESSPRIIARLASGESDETGRSTPRKNEHAVLRESRSRSRLRSLKFWKKKRDVSGVDSGNEGMSTSP